MLEISDTQHSTAVPKINRLDSTMPHLATERCSRVLSRQEMSQTTGSRSHRTTRLAQADCPRLSESCHRRPSQWWPHPTTRSGSTWARPTCGSAADRQEAIKRRRGHRWPRRPSVITAVPFRDIQQCSSEQILTLVKNDLPNVYILQPYNNQILQSHRKRNCHHAQLSE